MVLLIIPVITTSMGIFDLIVQLATTFADQENGFYAVRWALLVILFIMPVVAIIGFSPLMACCYPRVQKRIIGGVTAGISLVRCIGAIIICIVTLCCGTYDILSMDPNKVLEFENRNKCCVEPVERMFFKSCPYITEPYNCTGSGALEMCEAINDGCRYKTFTHLENIGTSKTVVISFLVAFVIMFFVMCGLFVVGWFVSRSARKKDEYDEGVPILG